MNTRKKVETPDFFDQSLWRLWDSLDFYYSLRDGRILDEEDLRKMERFPLDNTYLKIGVKELYRSKDSLGWGTQTYFLDNGYYLKSWGLEGDSEGLAALLCDDEWYVLENNEEPHYHIHYNPKTLEVIHFTLIVVDGSGQEKRSMILEA